MCRFRLIPGDLCESTSESKSLLKQVEKVCTAHEKDAGFYPENRRGGVSHVYLLLAFIYDLVYVHCVEHWLEGVWSICHCSCCLGNSSFHTLLLATMSEKQISVSLVNNTTCVYI